MRILGQYGTDGRYLPYSSPLIAYPWGAQLRDEDGFVIAIKDQYGDWVSPSMMRLGIKSKLEVIEAEASAT